MGNTNTGDEKVQDNQEFQSLKTTYRSIKEGYPYQHLQIQAITLEQKYLKWTKEMKEYLAFISQKMGFTPDQINRRFWLPISEEFVPNQKYCKENKGKAVLYFQGGYSNLTQYVLQRSSGNNPFTNAQLWHLLHYFSQSALLFRKSLPNFQLHSNKIMVNTHMKSIKFFIPYTQFQTFIPVRTESYISNQKLVRKSRRINASLDIEKRNDDFVVGMVLAECMLLQSCAQIYELGPQGKKYLKQQKLGQIINRVLKISYYPIKLKLIVVGLIQYDQNDRFTLNEVYQLLSSYKCTIQNFDTFHTTKTEITNIFGTKLEKIQLLIDKLNVQASRQIFQKGLATINRNKPMKPVQIAHVPHNKIKTPFEPREHLTHGDNFTNKTQSLNFSLSQIPKVLPKGDESMSLVWSKSELKSNRQQCALSTGYSPRLSYPIKEITKDQDDKKASKFNKIELENAKIQNFNKQNIQKEVIVQVLFDPFRKQSNSNEGASEKSLQINPQPVSFGLKTQSFMKEEQLETKPAKSNSLKIERAFRQTFKTQGEKIQIESENNYLYLSSKEQVEVDKKAQETQLNELIPSNNIQSIKIDSKPKIPQAKRLSQRREQAIRLRESLSMPCNNYRLKSNQDSLSQVVEYKSYLYESPHLQISPISFKHDEKSPHLSREEQKDEVKQEESDESPIHKKSLCLQNYPPDHWKQNNRESSRHLKQADSIINSLTNLISTKKIDLTESSRPSKLPALVPTEAKVAQYMKSFTKFSPELIAQLNLRSNYPEDERLKLKARESLNTNNIIMGQSRELFPLTEYPLNNEQNTRL